MANQHEPDNLDEMSVWDFLIDWIKSRANIQSTAVNNETVMEDIIVLGFPWFSFAAVILALIAQFTLEPSIGRSPWLGLIIYAAAGGCLIAAVLRNEWHLPELKPDHETAMSISLRMDFFLIGIFLAAFAFLMFGSGSFGLFNTALWVLSLILVFLSIQGKAGHKRLNLRACWGKFLSEGWQFRISRWTVIVLAVVAVILFFNFFRLDSVPPEMVSDQAEKLLDINDILNGRRSVYFPRNTGREPLHFYLTAAYMSIFNLEVSFLNLKVVAVFANLLTLFFIYLLGKEVGNKWVGLASVLFAGIAYWPLLFTRLALRIPYYPLFVAPVMYFMIRGFRRQNITDIFLTGLFLGLGLHGYTPFRIVPIFVVLGAIIYIFHKPGKDKRLETVFGLALITLVSVIVFIPLFRYWLANPDMFGYRAFSRLTPIETGFQKSPLLIFFENFWKASVMFFWDNGVIWAHSIPGRPALEVVSASFYFIGIVSLLIRYLRKRQWIDLVLLISIPMLMMPSILSLAYPGENPSLNRTAGAVVPVFVIIGLAFVSFIRTLRVRLAGKIRKLIPISILAILLLWSGLNNFDLVFNQYYSIYRASSWNTSEIGEIARFFMQSVGSSETTYVVGYPHWIDSRLVAINAGQTGLDFAIFPEEIPETAADPRSKMFFVNINDAESINLLQSIYSQGVLWEHDSKVENKDFMIFFVPPIAGAGADGS